MRDLYVLGVDLAGPSNDADTVAVGFMAHEEILEHRFTRGDLGDRELHRLIETELPAAAQLVVGLDAPLSYNPGGGDRPAERALRRCLIDMGLPAGTVMVPTMSRMVYLTLRGVTVARTFSTLRPGCQLVEVHPAGALAFRGAPVSEIRNLKKSLISRHSLITWLASQGLSNLPSGAVTDHTVAAYAAGLAAWDWSRGRAPWVHRADPPEHPFDLAC